MKKNKILIHSLVFSPDGVSTAYLFNDLALGFKDAGYEVVVLTTTPHYNILTEELIKQPLEKRLFGLYYTSTFHGINVMHVPQRKFKNFFARVLGFVYLHILSFFLGLSIKKIALIISPSPPLTIGLLSIIIGKLKGAKVIYNVQEIYPDFLINQGVLKSGVILSILRKLESAVYNYSDIVTTIDQVFYKTIVGRFNNPKKLFVIPNFVDTELYKPLDPNSNLLDRNSFPEKNVLKIMYAGNLGHAQDWTPLYYLAEKFKNSPVEFWIIGEGVMRENIETFIKENDFIKVHLLPYQSRTRIPAILNFADLHFIFMNPKMAGQGFPSKVYTIMACKKPLLIISEENSPLFSFLKDKNCSYIIEGNSEIERYTNLQNVVSEILNDPKSLNELGFNGYQFIQSNYSKNVVVRKYVELINSVLR